MTNKLAEQLGIDAKKLSHLLNACGMSEDLHDIEALKAVIAMRDSGEVSSNRQGYCLYVAQQSGVNAEEIHKAIEPRKIKTSDKGYLPLYINVCLRVAGGETAAQAVEAELAQDQESVSEEHTLPDPIKEHLRPTIKTAAKDIVHGAIDIIGSYKAQANAFVIKELQDEMTLVMQTPEVKEASKRLIEGSTPEKLPILEAHVEE